MARPARIIDVAKAAGVSPATVSYVLTGNRPISAATTRRVLKVIKELNYRPDPDARALKSRRSRAIGVLASDFSEVSISQIIVSVEQVACESDYHCFFASGACFGYDVRKAVGFLTRRHLDGLIVLFGVTSDVPVGEIGEPGIPLVSINRPVSDGHPCILPDNYDGGRRAALHLLEAGCSRLALISGPGSRFSSRERVRGFRDALCERGMPLSERRLYHGDFEYASGARGLAVLLKRDHRIDGVFCANDLMAAAAINAAVERGVAIPDRLKVIGYDDGALASIWPVPISSLTAPFQEMGQASAALLLAMIEGRQHETGTIYVKSKLVARRSTGH